MAAVPPPIIVVEDDPPSARLVADILGLDGHRADVVPSLEGFRTAFRAAEHAAVLLDLRLPDGDGLSLLRELRRREAATPVIVLTASDSAQEAVEAMKLGAFDFFTKPIDREKLRVAVRNALQLARRDSEIERLRLQLSDRFSLEGIVAASPAMKRALELARKCAGTQQTVLIQGESGTGKALIARAIHGLSPRVVGPFVEVNCAAVPESLLESELFGHERGAFTGATAARRGKFELAHGGTIFLDEIGDMLPAMQAKILHAVEERGYFRVGSDERRETDARIICATNHDLARDVREGHFRKDLFYRINGISIELRPLRERPEEIPLLAQHFLRLHGEREGRSIEQIDPEAMFLMQHYAWPGNVRELENVVARAVVVAETPRLTASDLPSHLRSAETPPPRRRGQPERLLDAVETLERRMILEALERNDWVKARAARDLGVTDRILSYKINTLGISRPGGAP
jgi:DNA-binding NtrC family response regulator